jgi:hypothetical protein
LAAAALTVLVLVTVTDVYPVAMVGVPGAEVTNMTPPTTALILLAAMQAGVILGTAPFVKRIADRPRVWHAVVAVSGVIMTIYLWHLSAMTLAAAAGLFTFDGVVFSIEPGSTAWWASRPAWLLALVTVTLLLVSGFARFEWAINQRPFMTRRRLLAAGVVLCVGSTAAVAWWGLANEDASINWMIPAAALVGAVLTGAYPARMRSGRARDRVS